MLRISTTTIESFRLFKQPDQDWMSEADLLATIRGEFVPTPAVLLGQAFGKVLETPDPFRVGGGYQHGDYVFGDEVMSPCLALMDRRGVFEVKATKQYGDSVVVAKADQIVGAHLVEHKTTLGTFDFDKYAESYQWRFMVDLFEAAWVTYHVFCLSQDRDDQISLRGIESFNVYPYADVHADCCDLVRQFVDYVTTKGLDGRLRARQSEALS